MSQIEREEVLALHPKYFGKSILDNIKDQLAEKLEGKCTGRYGYTIMVLRDTVRIGKGLLHEDTGYAHYPVRFTSIVFRPFKNEVLPARVTSINTVGIACEFWILMFG